MVSFKLKMGAKFFLVSSFLLLSVEQNVVSQEIKTEKIEGKRYILHDGSKSEVDESVITVKLKDNGNLEKLNKEYSVLRSNKLGYIDLLVPKGIDVEEYFTKLKESDLFDYIFWMYSRDMATHR